MSWLRPTSEEMLPRPRRSLGFRVSRNVLKIIAVVAICAVAVPPAVGAVAGSSLLFLELPGRLPEENPTIEALPSLVFDQEGNQIAVFREFDLTVPTKPEDVPQVIKDAVVAAEDQRFWDHNGVDVTGIARAARENASAGEIVQGGSTITQQYVKNTYLTSEKTVNRKLREAILATQLERRMTKDDILFNYLDTVYFGAGAYGVAAAAELYFAKPLAELTISEAATIAGIIPAPTRRSPRTSPKEADVRRKLVLDNMLELGTITQEQHDAEWDLVLWPESWGKPFGPATVVRQPEEKTATAYPYYVDWVERELLEQLGADRLYRGGLRVEIAIDVDLQAQAEEAVASRLNNTEAPVDMSLVSIENETGLVRAMVSNREGYETSQVNLATGGSTGFQPGSSFKVFVLTEAFRQAIKPGTQYNAPGIWKIPNCEFERCTIRNSGGGAYGKVDLRTATAKSINTVFGQLVVDVGIQNTVELAHSMGVSFLDPSKNYGVSLSLGAYEVSPLDMAAGYSVLANRGIKRTSTGVLRVWDKDGTLIIDNTRRRGSRVLDERVADNVTDVLTGVITGGTGKRAAIGRPAAGKTGTAQQYRAAWFVGYTPQYSTAVWMGHSDGQRSLNWINGVGRVTGGSHPAIAWSRFMRDAHQDLEVVEFPEPAPLPNRTDGDFQAGTGVGTTSSKEEVAPIRIRVGRAVSETDPDCGGPCQQFEGDYQLFDIEFAPSTTVAPPPPTTAPPTTAAPATTTSTVESAGTGENGSGGDAPATTTSEASEENSDSE